MEIAIQSSSKLKEALKYCKENNLDFLSLLAEHSVVEEVKNVFESSASVTYMSLGVDRKIYTAGGIRIELRPINKIL